MSILINNVLHMGVNQKIAQSAGILQVQLHISLTKLEMEKKITRCLKRSGCGMVCSTTKKIT